MRDISSRSSMNLERRCYFILFLIFSTLLFIPIASAEKVVLNGIQYYQKLDGSMTDTPSIITETSLGYRVDWLGMYYFTIWDGNNSYDTLNYPNGTFVSPWIMPRIEYWRTTGQPQWREVIPINNTFERNGNQIIRRMVMGDGSKFNITYTVTDKIKYTWDFTAGANQNYSIVFRMDSAASQVINNISKRYTPGFFNNLTIYDWTDIPAPYAQNISSSYSTSNRQFLQRIILGNLNASDPNNSRVIIDPQQQFNGSTTPPWSNSSGDNTNITSPNDNNIVVSKNNSVNEFFNRANGNVANGWTVSDNPSFQIEGNRLNASYVGVNYPTLTKSYVASGLTNYSIVLNASTNIHNRYFSIYGTENNKQFAFDFSEGGAPQYLTSSVYVTCSAFSPYQANREYYLTISYNQTSGNSSYYIDTTLCGTSTGYSSTTQNRIEITVGAIAGTTFWDNFRIWNTTTGNRTLWNNFGSGRQATQYIINATGNYSVYERSNATGNFALIGTYTTTDLATWNNQTIVPLTKYQFPDLLVQLIGNTTASQQLAQVTITDEAVSGGDTTPPTYSGAGHNQTVAGQPTLFSIQYNDETALPPNGQWNFCTNNTGSWVCDSAINWTATPQWANVTKTLNSTVGTVIGYRWNGTDNASNSNNTPIYTLTTTSAPLTEFMPPAPISLSCTNGNFYRNCTWQAGTGNVTTNYNTTVNGTAINGTQPPQNMSTAPHGQVNRTIRAYNASGNGTENLTALSDNFQIPNNIPVLNPIGNKNVNEGQWLNFSLIATDADGDPLTYASNSTLFPVNSTTGNVNVSLLYNQSGIYYVGFNATDNNSGVSFSNITITVTNIPLTLSNFNPASDPTTTAGNSQAFSLNINRTANVTWYLNGTQIQTNTSVTSASYTNLSGVTGFWNVTVIATDGVDTASHQWNWTVNPISDTNTTPQITNVVNGSVGDTWGIVNYIVNQSNAITFVKYSQNSDLSSSSQTTNQTSGTNRSDNITGLLNGTKYYYSVYAYNSSNLSLFSNSSINNFSTNNNVTSPTNGTPNIISWGNSNTSNNSLSLTVPRNTNITFNLTANQSVTTTWGGTASPTKINDSYGFKNFTSAGTFTVIATCSNANGSCTNPVTWTITVTGDGNLVNFSFTNASISESQIYQTSQATQIKVDVNDSDGFITSVLVGITFMGIEKNYTMSGGNNTWSYDFRSGVPGSYTITHFYATDNASGTNSTPASLSFVVMSLNAGGVPSGDVITLKGRIYDFTTKQPISGVYIYSNLMKTTTDPSGNYILYFNNPGQQKINITKDGFRSESFNIDLNSGTALVDIPLLKQEVPPPIQLSTTNQTVSSVPETTFLNQLESLLKKYQNNPNPQPQSISELSEDQKRNLSYAIIAFAIFMVLISRNKNQ